MKFETLKTNCARHAYNDTFNSDFYGLLALESMQRMIATGKMNKHRELTQELKNKIWDSIMNTDIRSIKTLSEAFPNIVPAWIKSGRYSPELTDEGWELIKIETD